MLTPTTCLFATTLMDVIQGVNLITHSKLNSINLSNIKILGHLDNALNELDFQDILNT